MDHGKLIPEKPRKIRVVIAKTTVSRQVVDVIINDEESGDINRTAETKAIAVAQTQEGKFIVMTERYRGEQQFDLTDEEPDPPVIQI